MLQWFSNTLQKALIASDTNPVPVTLSSSTFVVGPSSATDNAIVRFDGTTGKLVQNSAVTIADTTGAMVWAASQDASLTGGSSGATLVLGQGASGMASLNRELTFGAQLARNLTVYDDGTNADSFEVRAGSYEWVSRGNGGVLFRFGTKPYADAYSVTPTYWMSIGTNVLIGGTTDIGGNGNFGVYGCTITQTRVTPKTQAASPYAVSATTDNRVAFTNEGATAMVTFSLPTAAANLDYTFIVQDTDGITITANTGDTIRIAASATAAAGSISSTTIGSVVRLIAINATEWIAVSIVGTWA